jgi:maltodextrin utilization protein YvdJ
MMAPLAATFLAELAANGLSLISGALQAKGRAVVEEKLGVKLPDGGLSQEQVLDLRTRQMAHEQWLIEAAMRGEAARLADAADARKMNASIQTTAEASWLAKNAAYVLDFLIIGSTVLLGLLLFAVKLPVENKELALTVFGALLALATQCVQFHRGSSQNSRSKDSTIDRLTKAQP